MKKTILARILLIVMLLSVTLVSCDMDDGAIDFDRVENEIKNAVSTLDSYPHSEKVPADPNINWDTGNNDTTGNWGTGTGGYPNYDSDNLGYPDFQGQRIVFISRSVAGEEEALFSYGSGSTPLSQAVYQRLRTVEDRYNVLFDFIITSDSEVTNRVRQSYLAGLFEYDVAGVRGYNMMTFASEGGLENWNDLDCIDLSSSHWYESARENLAMPNGELYAMDGDISYKSLDSAGVMFFNEDLLANYGINNVYDKIANGTWTMEAFLSMVKDIDNPSGYVTLRSQAPLLAARSTGRSVVRNGGQYVFNWDNERTVSFMDDFLSVIKQTNIVTVNSTSDSTALLNNFLDGNAVFTDSSYGSIKEMKDINFSVGMAPWPKADVNDDGYTASVNATTTLYTIPINHQYDRVKMTSIVLDGFAKEGQKTLMKDYYYDQVLMRYCTSANMYDCAVLIHNSLTYDIGVMGNFSNAIAQLPATSYSSGTFASNVTSKSSQINAYILEWNTTFP